MAYVKLWDYLGQRQAELTSSQFRRLCRKELISYQRAREWQDVHAQLSEICRQLALVPRHERQGHGRQPQDRHEQDRREQDRREQDRRPPDRRLQVHRALLAGLVTQVGAREGDRADYSAPRGARFAIWPGSALAKKPPRWVMAAELVETGRLWAARRCSGPAPVGRGCGLSLAQVVLRRARLGRGQGSGCRCCPRDSLRLGRRHVQAGRPCSS